MKQSDSKRRLGRGLQALLGPQKTPSVAEAKADKSLLELPIAIIFSNPFQPRNTFDPEAMAELKASLKASGLLQPVVVRARGDGNYELIAGERRCKAARELGWAVIPAIVHEVDDRTMLTLALVENLQRDSLSPLDEARGYQRLIKDFGTTQSEVAELIGRNRSTVANGLRLLKLPNSVQQMLDAGEITTGHARALLQLESSSEMLRLANKVVEENLSVRDVEAATRNQRPPKSRPRKKAGARKVDPQVRSIEDALRAHLKTDVFLIPRSKESGRLSVNFYSNDDLARLLELLLGRPFEG